MRTARPTARFSRNALVRLKAAWQRYYDDWTTFANRKAQPAGMQQHFDTANEQSQQVLEDEIQAWTQACYIKSDIPEADKADE
jgi:hypothetical protein